MNGAVKRESELLIHAVIDELLGVSQRKKLRRTALEYSALLPYRPGYKGTDGALPEPIRKVRIWTR